MSYLYLDGSPGGNATTPDNAAISITSDIDIRLRVSLLNWATTNIILARAFPTATSNSFVFYTASGNLTIQLSQDGTNNAAAVSVAISLPANTLSWVRMTWRASDGQVQFFTAPGYIVSAVAGDFTQLGANQTITLASIFDTAQQMEIGSEWNGAIRSIGNYYRVQLYNGINGTLAYDANFNSQAAGITSFAESSSSAATVTLNGSAKLRAHDSYNEPGALGRPVIVGDGMSRSEAIS